MSQNTNPLHYQINTHSYLSSYKSASMKCGILLYRLRHRHHMTFVAPCPFSLIISIMSSPAHMILALYRSLVCHCIKNAFRVCGNSNTTAFVNREESKANRLVNSIPLIGCLQLLTVHFIVHSFDIFFHCFHGYCFSNLINANFPHSFGSVTQTSTHFIVCPS